MVAADSLKRNADLKVGKYAISTKYKGAYGIVYKATDTKNRAIAAKTITYDGTRNLKILVSDLERLITLDHENIVRIFDFHQQNETFCMFMEFCSHGDLNKFFNKHCSNLNQILEVMHGIVNGIRYLHSKDIIHRDIKPGNILIASESPLIPKLTDFDLSKFLDPEVETSVMSSNVGTNAFKSPEVFQRNDAKKISYHRNVDVYAAALTFLAMIQAQDKTKPIMLIPRIETPQEDSELHQPIGQLIAERIKYKVKELNIVIVEEGKKEADSTSKDVRRDISAGMRNLIRQMTCVKPENRLSATEVQDSLKQVSASSARPIT